MSHSSHQYHQPHANDSNDDNSDDDLALDLQELDPIASPNNHSASSPRHSRNSSSITHDFARRIPLRNLRAGRTRNRPPEDEDLQGLLDDGPESRTAVRDSAGSLDSAYDDAPLLPAVNGRRRRTMRQSETALSKLGSSLRFPSFLSDPSRSSHDNRQPTEDEPEQEHDPALNRIVVVGQRQSARFPLNAISNAKYTPWSFVPRTLYNEFKFFLNMYFLLVALSQIIPALRIGYLSTYIAPLAFVLMITLGKEAMDDIARRRRDAEANSEPYTVLKFADRSLVERGSKAARKKKLRNSEARNGQLNAAGQDSGSSGRAVVAEIIIPSRDLKVGDVLKLEKNQRVPADVVILQAVANDQTTAQQPPSENAQIVENLIDTERQGIFSPTSYDLSPGSELAGEAFIRTDQLDGETDWKLRLPSPVSQSLTTSQFLNLKVTAGKPDKRVNDFFGTIESSNNDTIEGQDTSAQKVGPLSIDNTAWANTVLASSSVVYAVVVYTGSQTRQALSTSASRSKTGLLELEINSLTKILCALTLSLSGVLVLIGRLDGQEERQWYISVMRFLILFSTVVPISLRVNLDMGKTVYAWFIEHDKGIPGTVVRTSTIPEDLGRIEYLLSDKTGTLTQNEMELKKVHVGTVSYANEAMDEVASYVKQAFAEDDNGSLVTPSSVFNMPASSATRMRRDIGFRVRDLVLALALCHNVTPTTEEENGETVISYQASSPDEIAIVRWTEDVGLRLLHRDRGTMMLQSTKTGNTVVKVRILNVFPFTSDSKRMGIIVQFTSNADSAASISAASELWFYQKGADTVMTSIVAANDWLDEETANMAREGLRTLVVGRKKITPQQYQEFSHQYSQASMSLQGRDSAMGEIVQKYLERDLELLGVTGVEDKLQHDVKPSLELLRNAGVKIWMLTGDKVETARCVAVSSKLVARGQYIHTIAKLKRKDLALESLNFLRGKSDACLLIDGESLAIMLTHHRDAFISIAVTLPTVVACRCSPTQKADVATLIRTYTKKRICCIGDGGNDVSMIQAADVGVGIVGKEGRQASLAADFSIDQFSYITKLLVWHGRNSYKRSAKLAQFVIHRGLIISVCQTMFSIASSFEPNALYRVCIPPERIGNLE
jgi:phospholipid-translocating ATPase